MKCEQCGGDFPHRKGRFCGTCLPPPSERDRRAAWFEQGLAACKIGRDFIARTIAESRAFATGKSLADIQLEIVEAAIELAEPTQGANDG